MGFAKLPAKFQFENLAAAESAVGFIVNYLSEQLGKPGKSGEGTDFEIPSAVIEKGAEVQHNDWLCRNGSWAPPHQQLSYEELAEAEKQKDRAIVQHTAQSLLSPKGQPLRQSLKQA